MNILLTNDDGIFAPGISALEKALRRLGNVHVVAPLTEQSGVGHQITFLTPLTVKKLYIEDNHWGWAVNGSPADCVKIAINEVCPVRPDLVVSGINGGLNAGINVLASGTVAAAVEAGFFGINSVAVSLEAVEAEPYDKAAGVAVDVIEQLLAQHLMPCTGTPANNAAQPSRIFNVNIPVAALAGTPRVKIATMDPRQYWEQFERRVDPFGRTYFWLTGRPVPGENTAPYDADAPMMTDLQALADGYVTVTPLMHDMTCHRAAREMAQWTFDVKQPVDSGNVPAFRTKKFPG